MSGTERKEKYQLLPDLPPDEYTALKADIAANGVLVPVELDELGINDYPTVVRRGMSEEEKRAHARKLNVLRRHLNREQTRALIEEQLLETPYWSNNRIGQMLGVDGKTIAAVRAGLETTSEIPKLAELVGADGKTRPTRSRRRGRRPVDLDDEDEDEDDRGRRRRDHWDDPAKRAKMDHAVDLIKMRGDPEKIDKLIREASVCVIKSSPGSYDPFAGRTEAEKLEWHLFMLFLSFDRAAGRAGGEPQGVADHVEWVLQRPFQNVAEWLGEEGDKFRRYSLGSRPVSEQFKADWAAFLAQNRDRTLPDVIKELEDLQKRGERELLDGVIQRGRAEV
jgi:hypothetical protein